MNCSYRTAGAATMNCTKFCRVTLVALITSVYSADAWARSPSCATPFRLCASCDAVTRSQCKPESVCNPRIRRPEGSGLLRHRHLQSSCRSCAWRNLRHRQYDSWRLKVRPFRSLRSWSSASSTKMACNRFPRTSISRCSRSTSAWRKFAGTFVNAAVFCVGEPQRWE
jgi:hypothetical protein